MCYTYMRQYKQNMFQMKFGNHTYKININIYIRLIYTDIYVQIKMGSCAWISLSILLLPLVSERESYIIYKQSTT